MKLVRVIFKYLMLFLVISSCRSSKDIMVYYVKKNYYDVVQKHSVKLTLILNRDSKKFELTRNDEDTTVWSGFFAINSDTIILHSNQETDFKLLRSRGRLCFVKDIKSDLCLRKKRF